MLKYFFMKNYDNSRTNKWGNTRDNGDNVIFLPNVIAGKLFLRSLF